MTASASLPSVELRLAELVATLSLASDIGVGQPYEHAQRAAIGAVLIGEAMGASESDLKDTYYLTLLRFIGCVGDDDVGSRVLGEDVGEWASHLANGSPLAFLSAIVQNTGKHLTLPKRAARSSARLPACPP